MSLRNSSETPPSERRSRGRQWLAGCGVMVVLFVGVLALLLRDEPPPDVSDLLPPEPESVAEGEGCEAALLDLQAARGRPPDWWSIIDGVELEDIPDPWGTESLDGTYWVRPEVRGAMRDRYDSDLPSLDKIDDALARTVGGWTPFLDEDSPVFISELGRLRDDLGGRALWRAIEGDFVGASEDARRMGALGDRLVGEANLSIVHWMVGGANLGRSQMIIEGLARRGQLAPEVEDWLIARTPVTADPDSLIGAIRHEFRFGRQFIARFAAGETDLGPFEPDIPLARRWIKPNRSTRRLAEKYRAWIRRAARDPVDRSTPELGFDAEGAWKRALWALDSGEILLAAGLLDTGSTTGRLDTMRVREVLLRWGLALARHERRHGTLPATLSELAAESPELGAVPVDPFSGNPYRYDPARRVLWSVGEDGVDDGGSSAEAEDGSSFQGFTELGDWTFVVPEPRSAGDPSETNDGRGER